MPEFFVVANSFAAPFFSDTDEQYVKGKTAQAAMDTFRKKYAHPAGLFAAALFINVDAYHKGKKALVVWLSAKAKKIDSKVTYK